MNGDTFCPFCCISSLYNIYKSHGPVNEITNHLHLPWVDLDRGSTFNKSLIPAFRALPTSKLHNGLRTQGTIQKQFSTQNLWRGITKF